MSNDNDDEYKVGYGKPPLGTCFVKGQSGNLLGRPPKRRKSEQCDLPVVLPSAKLFEEEARREVSVKSGDRQEIMPAIQAVMRAQHHKAMSGSVYAQRAVLERVTRNELIEFSRRRTLFEFWQDYVRKARGSITRAAARGEEEPPFIPHPGDLEFDYDELTVCVAGPINSDEYARIEHIRHLSDLVYEMSVFDTTAANFDASDPQRSRVDIWLLHFAWLQSQLPRRLRGVSDKLQAEVAQRIYRRGYRWKADLKERFSKMGLPFLQFGPGSLTWPIGDLKEAMAILPPATG